MALPKRHRLRGHRAIDRLHRQGKRHHSAHLLLRVVPAEPSLLAEPDRRAPPSAWRCALVISAKVHKRAVVRNRLRRLLHRHLLASLSLPAEPRASAAVVANAPAGCRSRTPPERQAESQAVDQAAGERQQQPDSPLWLMVSLRPGSAELDTDQLLGECSFLLRRAGLIR